MRQVSRSGCRRSSRRCSIPFRSTNRCAGGRVFVSPPPPSPRTFLLRRRPCTHCQRFLARLWSCLSLRRLGLLRFDSFASLRGHAQHLSGLRKPALMQLLRFSPSSVALAFLVLHTTTFVTLHCIPLRLPTLL